MGYVEPPWILFFTLENNIVLLDYCYRIILKENLL